MDFSLDDDQIALQDAVRRYCDQALPLQQRGERLDAVAQAARWRALAELGLTGLGLAEDVGGSARTPVEAMLVAEELGRGLAASAFVESAVLCGTLIEALATPAQRSRWLAPLAEGRSLIVLALDEPAAHERAGAGATALAADGGWRLDGCKTQVMHADIADLMLVLARSADAPAPALFVVPTRQPGVTLHPGATLDGHAVARVEFNALFVPEADRLGAPGRVGAALEASLDAARAALCAECAGGLSVLLELCIEQLRTRRQFGRPLAEFQALQHRLAELFIAVEQVRSMSALAAMAVHESAPAERARLVSAARVTTDDAARLVGEWAVQLHGAMGMTEECRVAHYVRRLLVAGARYGSTGTHLRRYAAVREEVAA